MQHALIKIYCTYQTYKTLFLGSEASYLHKNHLFLESYINAIEFKAKKLKNPQPTKSGSPSSTLREAPEKFGSTGYKFPGGPVMYIYDGGGGGQFKNIGVDGFFGGGGGGDGGGSEGGL